MKEGGCFLEKRINGNALVAKITAALISVAITALSAERFI